MGFLRRHIEEDEASERQMLRCVGARSLSSFVRGVVPKGIAIDRPLRLPAPVGEQECLRLLRAIGRENTICKNFIGEGYYGSIMPYVVQRNILENPGWYTSYTPYQAEIAQGRLEALLNFQTMCSDLTGMEMANASLLDEATAAAEAMVMLWRLRPAEKSQASVFLVDEALFNQTIDVLLTRAEPFGIRVIVEHVDAHSVAHPNLFGLMVQYPDKYGSVRPYEEVFTAARKRNVYVAVCANLLALTLFTPPGEMGSDVVVGSTQNFGLPLGYGGPHAAYLATRPRSREQFQGAS